MVQLDVNSRKEAERAAQHPAIPTGTLRAILGTIEDQLGADFSGYKRSTIERRLSKRMEMLKIAGLENYLIRFRDDVDEQAALARDLLIHVTSFFRDPESFELAQKLVIRPMLEKAEEGEEVRIWVPGCSTGQEAYSLAMMIDHTCEQLHKQVQVSIFASDIDMATIEQARRATYPVAMLGEIPEQYREKYTAASDKWFAITPRVRDMVHFWVHNAAKDPPFTRIDCVSCRNLLIYLDEDLQARLLGLFHFSLKPGGHLFLGACESVRRAADLFDPLDHKARIFARNDTTEPELGNLTLAPLARTSEPVDGPGQDLVQGLTGGLKGGLTGDLTSPRHSAFDASTALMLSPCSLLSDARSAQQSAIGFMADDRLQPLADRRAFEPLSRDQRIEELEANLRAAHLSLKVKVAQIENANEELRSSNEEILSMNEELQLANEKLTSANDALKHKIDALTQASADLDNFLQSADLAMIVLDRAMRVRHVTDAARNMLPILGMFNASASARFSVRLGGINLSKQVRKVMERGKVFSQTIEANQAGQSYFVRITPYSSASGPVEGASITLVDISQEVELRRDLVAETRKLKLAMDTARMGVWDTDLETGEMVLDPITAEILDLEAGVKLPREAFFRHQCPQDVETYNKVRNEAFVVDKSFSYTLRLVPPGRPTKWVRIHSQFYLDRDGRKKKTGLCFDITDTMHLQQELQQQSDLRDLVMNAGRMGMIDLDAERGIVSVDAMLAEHLNLPGTGEIPLDAMLSNCVEEDAVSVQEHLARAIERGEEYELDFRVKDPEVGIRWVRTRGRPYTTIDGVRKVAGPTLDISAMKDQQMLVEEMSHRIKNLFAVLAGLIQAAPKQHPEASAMASDLLERVVSLGRVYDLARKENGMKGLPLGDLLHSILAPHAVGHSITIEGPAIFVDGDKVNTLTLIIHELSTNAAKYGALGSPDGKIDIRWRVNADRRVQLKWFESRPDFSPPEQSKGFGSLLIDTGVRQLKGQCMRRFDRAGASIELDLTL